MLWTPVKEMNKNELLELQPWPFFLPLTFMLSLIWVTWFCLSLSSVSLNFISCIFNFRVPFRICPILWPFPELCSTMPTPRPTAFTEATSYPGSISLLFPALCRCLTSSSAHLWWRLNSSLSSSIFLLISQVSWFESIFKSFLLLNSVSAFWYSFPSFPWPPIYCRL